MTFEPIQTATSAQAERCIATIVASFASDPPSRWMYADPQQYLENFPQFVRAFGGRAFAHGTAHYTDRFRAVALWLPPGIGPDDEALVNLIEQSVSPKLRQEVFALFEQMGQYHPRQPHWHLPLIATDPLRQGCGLGSALLRHALGTCDRQGTAAYLEATTDRNVQLYRRHGFEVLGIIQVGTSPPIYPMLRKPAK